MDNLFDFAGSPLARGPDLRDMSRINISQFVEQLAEADVVCCVSPDGSFVVLPPGSRLCVPPKTRRRCGILSFWSPMTPKVTCWLVRVLLWQRVRCRGQVAVPPRSAICWPVCKMSQMADTDERSVVSGR